MLRLPVAAALVHREHAFLHVLSFFPIGVRTVHYAFDVTPTRLVDGLITKRGIVSPANLAALQTA